jgi:hypothetical protein
MNVTDINLLFNGVLQEQQHIDEFNRMLFSLDEKKRKKCTIYPTDSAHKIRKKCKKARVWGLHYAPVWDRYVGGTTAPDTTSDSGEVDVGGDTAAGGDGGVAEIQGSGLVYPNSIGPEQDTEFTNEQYLKPIIYTYPDTDYEWYEAERYPEFKSAGKDKWEELVQAGEVVPFSALGDVNNHDPELKNLDPDKVKHVSLQIKSGEVELPIVGEWPDGGYELISGNTRIAILRRLGYDPEVLLISIPSKKKRKAPATRKKTKPKGKPAPKKKPSKEKPKSSTERVRRYYKRHPEKVRKYLKNTQDDRVKRNGDRAKAVKKYGKNKMKNHDVHHPNGVNGGSWRLAKKDHGRDKKNENVEYVYLSELMEGLAPNGPWVLLNEGGAAGHLAHPYEDNDLTFRDVKEMIKRGLVGGLDAEAAVTEKLDGQNIMFTVRDGNILFARNKSQVKNKGKNALDVAGIRSMFAGRGDILKAFGSAAEDLQSAVNALPEEEQQQMFADGSKFMNVEIVFPDTKNVIPYDKNVLVFHGTVSYDDEGNEIGRDISDGKALSDNLTRVNAQQQKTFGLSGPRSISFSDAETAENMKKMKEYGRTVSRIQDEFQLDDNDTISDYKTSWWAREIDSMGVDWTPEEKEGLVRRWALGDKKFGVKNIEDAQKKKVFREYEANTLKRAQKAATRPLERVFLRLGADTLKRVSNFLSANNPEIAAELKRELLATIKTIQETGDESKLQKLQMEIERLEDIGVDNIVPSEGIVFMYKGNPYKFTGAFAPVNQILGTLKFAKGKAEETEEVPEPTEEPKASADAESTDVKEPPAEEPRKTVAIFTGRFQPFHAGHYSVYRAMVEKFGKENVYIATSNKTDSINSPFGFADKKEIMMKMFKIPESRIVQVKNPYAPKEILGKLPDNTVYVTAVSQKDSDRLSGGKYFKSYEDTPSAERKGYGEAGYYMIAPEMQLQLNGKNISGTQIRELMGSPNITDRAKQEIFTRIYGQFDKKLFDKIVRTTTQSEEAKQLTTTHGSPANKAQARMKPQEPPEIPQAQPQEQPPEEQPVTTQEPQPSGQPTAIVDPTQQMVASPVQEPPVERDTYQPGETWETGGGYYGAKNSSGVTRYYTTAQSALRYSQT